MKNQLFRISPDLKITNELLTFFGIIDINDNHSFTRNNLKDLKKIDKINEIKERLLKYYLPCKNKYLEKIDEKRSITILRQFLKVNNHTLISKEKYIKGKKYLFYQVIPSQIDIYTKNRKNDKVIISFD